MATTILLCTDGSKHALETLASGLAALRPAERMIVVTVVENPDETLVTGDSGMAGGTMSPEVFRELKGALQSEGERIVTDAVAHLGVDGLETRVLHGHPGDSLCTFASEIGAAVIVMGSRGRGGVRRALFGSVSDFVVRNAPCPVLIVRETATSATDR